VFGTCRGSFAQYTTTRASRLAPKPASLTFEQAAALPNSATTALQALRDKAKLRPGQHVLIIGASGGVGTSAVQIAKAFGAEVTGACAAAIDRVYPLSQAAAALRHLADGRAPGKVVISV
jgi:NADPH:quinone reductase-like Zn-dependent oxidoreductase